MKYQELLNMGENELKSLLKEVQGKMHMLKQKAFARSLKTVHELPSARQTIARIKTILQNRLKVQK